MAESWKDFLQYLDFTFNRSLCICNMEYVRTFCWIHNVTLLWLCSAPMLQFPLDVFVGELFGTKWMSK